MTYILSKGLHYCLVGGQIVFMDLRTDTYFLLTGASEQAFRAYLANDEIGGTGLAALLAKGVLTEGEQTGAGAHTIEIPVPRQSASELALIRRPAGPAILLEVAWLVYTTRRGLRTRNIGELLDAHVNECRGRTSQDAAGPTRHNTDAITHAAAQFRNARRFVPVEHSCLLDSLALDRFLAKRGLESKLVFGVNAEPFSAHAWLQAGDMALNETVSYARMHTPILVL